MGISKYHENKFTLRSMAHARGVCRCSTQAQRAKQQTAVSNVIHVPVSIPALWHCTGSILGVIKVNMRSKVTCAALCNCSILATVRRVLSPHSQHMVTADFAKGAAVTLLAIGGMLVGFKVQDVMRVQREVGPRNVWKACSFSRALRISHVSAASLRAVRTG